MNLLKVYGFPRSGNHLLMQLIADNFYPGTDLATPAGQVGHWTDRVEVPPVECGKLSGHHGPPSWGWEQPAVYVYRDGRAVASSLFNSPHFKHPMWEGRKFGEFIRAPLDWKWSPGRQRPVLGPNVIQHWAEHLAAWWDEPILKVRYEELVAAPAYFLEMFVYRFRFELPKGFVVTNRLVGHFPSGGMLDGWRDMWSAQDNAWFFEQVGRDFPGMWRG